MKRSQLYFDKQLYIKVHLHRLRAMSKLLPVCIPSDKDEIYCFRQSEILFEAPAQIKLLTKFSPCSLSSPIYLIITSSEIVVKKEEQIVLNFTM